MKLALKALAYALLIVGSVFAVPGILVIISGDTLLKSAE